MRDRVLKILQGEVVSVYLHLTEVAEVDARAVIEKIFQRPLGGGKGVRGRRK